MAKTLEEMVHKLDGNTYACHNEIPKHVLTVEGRQDIRLALDSGRLLGVLNHMACQLRQWDKYGMQDAKSVGAAVAHIRKEFYSTLEEYHVNLDSYDEGDI